MNTNKFFVTACLLFCAAGSAASANQVITTFGTSAFTQLAPFGADTQDVNSYTISGSDGGSTLVGSLTAPFNLVGTPGIILTGILTFSTNPSSDFQIGLYDSDGDGILYNSNWANFNTSGQSISLPLSFAASDPSGNGVFSGVIANFVLATNGSGLANINFRLTNLTTASVIPEPSAAAALGGLIALGAVATRRRRSA